MAFRIEQFYNVSAAVGKGQPNRSDDVLLVRFFLKEIVGKPVQAQWKPNGTLPVVENWDQQLTDWIKSFQESFSTNVLTDGIVNTARGFATQRSTISNSVYTIVLLNNCYRSSHPLEHFAALWAAPNVPDILRRNLLINSV